MNRVNWDLFTVRQVNRRNARPIRAPRFGRRARRPTPTTRNRLGFATVERSAVRKVQCTCSRSPFLPALFSRRPSGTCTPERCSDVTRLRTRTAVFRRFESVLLFKNRSGYGNGICGRLSSRAVFSVPAVRGTGVTFSMKLRTLHRDGWTDHGTVDSHYLPASFNSVGNYYNDDIFACAA